MRRWLADTDRSRGQALVEFALVIPIFLLLSVALFDMGRAVFAYNTLTNAAREGARMAIVNQDKAMIVDWAKRQSAMIELDDPSVQVDFYQMAANGTPDTRIPATSSRVGCRRSCRSRPPTARSRRSSAAGCSGGVTFTASRSSASSTAARTRTSAPAQCPKHS
jgi:hypothetical protein